MVVPAYCRSRQGHVFRIHRVSERLGPDRMRYTLRATPIPVASAVLPQETSREVDRSALRDQIRLGQVIATPEQTFEGLWQQLRLDIDAP